MRLCVGLVLAVLFTGNVYGTAKDTPNGETNVLNDHDSESSVNTYETASVTRFHQISHMVKSASLIDITLPRETFEEECYIQPPNGYSTNADIFDMKGVKVQNKSNFVSCRVTIGPMITDLIGNWELCGKSVKTEELRCQPISITWAAPDIFGVHHPDSRPRETHHIHIGDTVKAGVTGPGDLSSCHIVTPDGEDLVITPELKYPHLERSSVYDYGICNVAIKDITEDLLGDWLIYGRFYQHIFGVNEARLPLTLKLHTEVEENITHNVTTLSNQEHTVQVGSYLTVQVTHTTGAVENCIYTTPSGLTFDINSDVSGGPSVQIGTADEEAVCKINFNPITEDVFGEWQLIGKFKDGLTMNEKRLTFKIIEEASDEDDTTMLNPINHLALEEDLIDISLNRESFEEECFLRPPNGDLTTTNLITMIGVTVQKQSNFVSCRVTIGPITEDLLGVWTLCGKSVENEDIRCQPVSIALRTGTLQLNNQNQFTHPVHFGGSVNSGVSSTGALECVCHVVTPAGEDLVITSDVNYPHIERSTVYNNNLCSVLFSNITEDMLGAWLIYGRFRSILALTEVRLPLVFNLYDVNNPYSQAFNVTNLQNENHLVNLGTNLTLEVSQSTGVRLDCIYRAPSGITFSIDNNDPSVLRGVYFNSANNGPVCQISFNPITEDAVGEWQISLKAKNGVLFDERRLTFRIIEEDPENPLQEDIKRNIEYLAEQNILTEMNTSHRMAIGSAFTVENESCHLIDPDGRQYAFIDGFNVPNVEIIRENSVECGVILHLVEENMIGTWTILGRARRFSDPIERRLPVTIRVEENFLLQNDIRIRKGGDLYLHLNDAISVPDTCMLIGPDGTGSTEVEVDPAHASSCGYIVRNVNHTHDGTWIIEYGLKIKRRGNVNVQVLDAETYPIDNLRWTLGDSVNVTVGPENAVYCIIQDSYGHKLFDGFGPCRIVLERVSVDHRGMWTLQIGKQGAVRLQQYNFYVEVTSVDGLSIVTTSVEKNPPSVVLTCSVPAQQEVHACKFRDPGGNTLIAAHGVGQDNYTFSGAVINYESVAHNHDCTLRLINPSVADLGIWRCGLDTSTGTHFGFLTVVCPHLMQNPEVAATVVTEPVLRSTNASYLEGDRVTLSCSVPSALRYCYFRARNGTTFNVFPRMSLSQNFEYVGAGLDAGECGIRFNRFSANEAGLWSCHVGLLNTTAPELRADVLVNVTAKMTVRHYWSGPQVVVVEAQAYNGNAIEYCRFVRMNGEGFTSDNVPDGYELEPTLDTGYCTLRIRDPNMIDLLPWTVVAKLEVEGGEVSMTTTNNLLVSTNRRNPLVNILFWVIIFLICLVIVAAAGALVPKKNRDWTHRRASQLSRSFRNSWNKTFVKKAPAPAVTQGV